MNFDQIRMFMMMVLLFTFGLIYSCTDARNAYAADQKPAPTVEQIQGALVKNVKFSCMGGGVFVVNIARKEIRQLWMPFKNPDGNFVSLPVTCNQEGKGMPKE